MFDARQHWDNIYLSKKEDELTWFQSYPSTSVEFLDLFDLPLSANIIDIGGGDGRLVDVLLDKGFKNVWVLDLSQKAIERAKQRLGFRASNVHWIVSDILDFEPEVKFDFWHDRAAFHFLTSEENISRYISLAERSLRKGGYLVLGTFSEQGPKKCSGLEIRQYSEMSMSARFELSFERIKCREEGHITPLNAVQHFLFCSFKKL